MKRLSFLIIALILNAAITTQGQTLAWAKQMGGTGSDAGYSIAVDAAGNIYTTGTFTGTADFDPGPGVLSLTSAGLEDVFITKLNAAGNIVWAKRIGGSNQDVGVGIAVDAAGNVFITGSFKGTCDFDPGPGTLNFTSPGIDWDIFIAKLDASGNLSWAKQFGGATADNGGAITVDAAGNVYATGLFQGTIDFDTGPGVVNLTSVNQEMYVTKMDGAGNLIWAKNMGGPGGFRTQGHAIKVDASGNVYITGNFLGRPDMDPGQGVFLLDSNVGGGNADAEIFICKLNASGNFVWAKQLTGAPYHYCYGYSIALDNAGNIYTTGSFKDKVDFDPGPGVFNITAGGLNDGFVLKLNSSGDFVWAKALGGCQNEDYGSSIMVDPNGDVYTTGVFQLIGDFDPGPGIYDFQSAGGTDVYISKLNSSGNFIWAKQLGGAGHDRGNCSVMDASGNIYTVGSFQVTADFDPGPGTMNFTSYGSDDIFIHKLSQTQILPLQWISFTVEKQGINALLKWKTLNGQNTKDFTIQHSTNRINWNTLSIVAAKTDTNGIKDYTYIHAGPLIDSNYYRIMQTDITGKASYSDTQSIKFSTDLSMIILKNPVTNGLLQVQVNKVTTISLFNDIGDLILKQTLNPGITTITVAGFGKGVYYLNANGQIKKILVQ